MQDVEEKQRIADARDKIKRCITQGITTSVDCAGQEFYLPSDDPLLLKFRAERSKARFAEQEKTRKVNAEKQRAAAEIKKVQAEIKNAQLEAAKELAEAGWREQLSGIYVRWCTKTCSQADVIGDSTFSLMEVWCKERACGDIYAQANFVKNGTTVGWTNDTLYLGYGQKGVLTFQKYGYEGGGSVQLVKFSARG